ncbi:MAG: thiamine phosphate synthase [Gemmatimonadales bacterium]|nr:MAG: thiamine phosphate synthase [Gemmatimonadales bacterium]
MSRTEAGGGKGEGPESRAGRVPRLHLITDGAILTRDGFVATAMEVAEALAESGRDSEGEAGSGSRESPVAFHLRGPGLSGRALWELGRRLAEPLQARGLRFLVNDRADVARALGADGVHLAERSLSALWLREWLGADALLGRSIHDPHSARRAGAVAPGPDGRKERASLDYLMVGTLWATASHPGRPGAGIERLLGVRSAIQAAGVDSVLPLIGIGGVTPERVAEVLDGGGYGVAVKGGVWEASDPAAAVVRFRERLRESPRRNG